MSELSSKIITLREQGKSYREIQAELGCSKSTIAYWLNDQEKENTRKRTQRLRSENSLIRKTENFQAVKGQANKVTHFHVGEGRGKYTSANFNFRDVVEYLDGDWVCYLTGDPIDLDDPKSYSFDHIVSASRGGTNELHNLGLTTRDANMAKADMELEDFIDLCVKVAKHFGRV